jgi:hypothetical protein
MRTDKIYSKNVPIVSGCHLKSGFARKWREMDGNKYIIGHGVCSVIQQPTSYVK